ncbi:MAG TPA: M23 family metallopeptidase [Firmicutes bacterium]|nr:M23 family metallopeptidase [Candidatus Fermentithermobacillaceae bacterium]
MEESQNRLPSRKDRRAVLRAMLLSKTFSQRLSALVSSRRVTFAFKAALLASICIFSFLSGIYLGVRSMRAVKAPWPEPDNAGTGVFANLGTAGNENKENLPSGNSTPPREDTSASNPGEKDGKVTVKSEGNSSPSSTTSAGPSGDKASQGPSETETVSLTKLTWPVQGKIVREPGWYFSEDTREWRYFPGVDIETKQGDQVKAALPGVVKIIFKDALLGDVVVINHGPNLETRYAGLANMSVRTGDHVRQGEVIGQSGNGKVHFEVIQDGNPLNPRELVKTPGN